MANTAFAQPLKLDWDKDLLGKWQVFKMDTVTVPEKARLFLEFLPDKVLMINQGRIREGEWKIMDVERKILIKTEEGVESWDLIHIDAESLSMYDTLGKTTVHFKKYTGEIENTLTFAPKTAFFSDVIGTWLVVSVNGQKTPVNLKIVLNPNGTMELKVGKELQKATWKMDETRTRILLSPEGGNPIQWIITDIDSEHLSFYDAGDEMRMTRYIMPITPDQEKKLLGKWQIIEVGGARPQDESVLRTINFNVDGTMTFQTNEKKEGEGTWGLSDTKVGIHIVSQDANEYWKILSYGEDHLLMEMGGVKMLLRKRG